MRVVKLSKYSDSNTPATLVEVGELALYFSYETIVAFRLRGKVVCSENVWSATTGRHLAQIEPDKSKRVTSTEFEKRLEEVLARLDGAVNGLFFEWRAGTAAECEEALANA